MDELTRLTERKKIDLEHHIGPSTKSWRVSMRRRRPSVGTVLEFPLPNGQFAYGRCLRDAGVAFYRTRSTQPDQPPIGERDYEFVVGVYDDVVKDESIRVVGRDPAVDPDDEWPPAQFVRDPITNIPRIYYHGVMRPSTEAEVEGLEIVTGWNKNRVIERLLRSAPKE